MTNKWVEKPHDEEHCNYNEAIGYELEPYEYTYTERDVILYALGVGVGNENPSDPKELPFIYENNVDFAPLPSFAVIPPFQCISQVVSVPGLVFHPMKLLHGESYVEIKKPLATAGTLRNEGKIVGIYDKKKAASVVLEVRSYDENNEEVALNRSNLYIRGIGNFGGSSNPDPNSELAKSMAGYPLPKRLPDFISAFKTNPNQAALYRLSGDNNPLHIDPDMAGMGGFTKPILHGLCSFGIATRAIVKHICGNDPSRVYALNARFAKTVVPGQTLVTCMWLLSEELAVFEVRCKETNEVVISNGYAKLSPCPTVSQVASKL